MARRRESVLETLDALAKDIEEVKNIVNSRPSNALAGDCVSHSSA